MKMLFDAKGIKKKYGKREVVKGINLNVGDNEILAIIGPNGAGKTTTLDMILGLIKPDSGKIAFWCEDYKKYIGAQLQSTPFFPGISTIDNLQIFSAFYGIKLNKNQLKDVLEKFSLAEEAKTIASRLSGGQQKKLALAITTIHKPKLIFLDEPTAALDPKASFEVRQMIKKLNNNGTAVIFTSHDMDEVAKIAHRVVMISDGEIIAEGSPEQLYKSHEVQNLEDLYLKLTNKEEC